MANAYGIQKVEETNVRTNKDIALSTGSMALQGAQMGSQFGPIGAGVGAIGMGAAGLIKSKSGKRKEERALEGEEARNEFVDNLEGRSMRNPYEVNQQAKNGMNFSKYNQVAVEIEGDGSGDPNGIGEVHVDKNYNIKNMAVGAPTHDEGGVKIPVDKKYRKGLSNVDAIEQEKGLTDKDIIFPWQKDEKKFRKGMRMIKQFKLNRDPKAKEWLDNQVAQLPTNADYAHDEEQTRQYGNGLKADMRRLSRDKKIDLTRKDIKAMSDGDIEAFLQDYTSNNEAPRADEQDFIKSNAISPQGDMPDAVAGIQPPQYKEFPDHDKKWDYRVDQQTGGTDVKLKAEKNWRPKSASWDQKNANEGGLTNEQLTQQRVQPDWKAPQTKHPSANTTGIDPLTPVDYDKDGPTGDIDNKKVSPAQWPDWSEGYEKDPTKPKAPTTDQQRYDGDVGNYNNPLKYASVANNFMTGMDTVDKVTRRDYTPELQTYTDRSDSARSANVEQRNFMSKQSQNRVGRSGSLGTQAQVGAQYMRNAERINEGEAKRFDATERDNTQTLNKAKYVNYQAAGRYDQVDAQSEAVRKAYKDKAYSGVSELAQLGEQRQYQRNRDLRKEQMQIDALPLVGTTDFQAGQNADGTFSSDYKGNGGKSTGGAGPVLTLGQDGSYAIEGGGKLVEVSPGVWKKQ